MPDQLHVVQVSPGKWCFHYADVQYSGLIVISRSLPVDRQRVHDVFHMMDVDDSGSLDKEEFREVMMVLCSNIFTRVLVQCT